MDFSSSEISDKSEISLRDLESAPTIPTGDVAAWLKERCKFGKFSSRGHYLYRSYRSLCHSRNECPISKSDWRNAMANFGLSSQRDNSEGRFHGIGLKPQTQNAHE